MGLAWSYFACCKRHAELYGYQVAIPQPSLRQRLRRGRGRPAGGGPSAVLTRPLPHPAETSDGTFAEEAASAETNAPRAEPHHRERISPLGR
jgi:hypothetical protein